MTSRQATEVARAADDGSSNASSEPPDVQIRGAERSLIRIAPPSRWPSLGLKELWSTRELLYFLVWRDVKVRYKQTGVGVAWALIQPILTIFAFSLFFGRLAGVPSDGIPYPLFLAAGLIPWQLFVFALSESGKSVVVSQQLITKLYFPRLVIPLAPAVAGLVDFAIAFILLLALMAWYGVVPTIAVVTLPLFVALALATAVGAGLWLSALNARYRDVQYTIPFLTQLWFVLTPIAYSASSVPEKWQIIYGLNPMAGVVEGFRWALLDESPSFSGLIVVSVAVTAVLLASGHVYFRRTERSFADFV